MGDERVENMIISQLERIEGKLDKFNDRIGKVESRVSRIEAIGSVLQLLWGALITFLSGRWD
jgi:hypothetical protein